MLLDSNETKEKILAEFLPICAFDGWTQDALLKAISQCKIEEKFAGLIFENGCLDLAEFYVEFQNKKAAQKLAEITDFHSKKIREKIRLALYARFEVEKNNQLALQRLRNFYLDPKNFTSLEIGAKPAIQSLQACYKISDFIWKEINDQSTDFNFYTKRLTLAKIILRSFAVFVKDESQDFVTTKNFVDSQIESVMKFEKRKQQVKKVFNEVFLNQDGAPKSAKEFVKNLPFFRLIKFK
ncbi:MAG: COQ9 family protein [Rickettsiales bacterium]|nr:COQ9 family protein [Rickettsiales bacterium]